MEPHQVAAMDQARAAMSQIGLAVRDVWLVLIEGGMQRDTAAWLAWDIVGAFCKTGNDVA